MKVTNVKSMIAKTMTAGLLAGAFFLASPSKAQAQVSWGVHVGVPVQSVYAEPAYGYAQPAYGYYDGDDRRFEQRRRWEARRQYEIERHEQMERREQWERQQAYRRHEEHEEHERMEHGYGYYGR